MRTLGFDHETARRVALGIQCAECSEPFVIAHGRRVICEHCWKKLPAAERTIDNRATEPEATAAHYRNAAKKRKAKRNV